MKMSIQTKNSKVGMGIILGVSIGFIVGLLFLDGNIGIGLAIGAALGIIFGSIADARTTHASQQKDETPATFDDPQTE